MKIEEGKSYLDERGAKWWPHGRDSGIRQSPWRVMNDYGQIRFVSDDGIGSEGFRLVSEAPPDPSPETAPTGPVVVETAKRIVEGVYGLVRVDVHRSARVFYIDPEDGYQATPEQLRAAAATLTEIADALDEGAR